MDIKTMILMTIFDTLDHFLFFTLNYAFEYYVKFNFFGAQRMAHLIR